MEKILKIIKLKLIELLGIILIAASLIYLFSIITYSADKINYIFPEEKNIHNNFIIIFNYFSDFFLQSFGIFCLLIFINTNIWSFQIILNKNKEMVLNLKSMGSYMPTEHKIWVYTGNRNTADIIRTLAHELVHVKQKEDVGMEDLDGTTGSEHENEANSISGILLRKYGREHPEIYD